MSGNTTVYCRIGCGYHLGWKTGQPRRAHLSAWRTAFGALNGCGDRGRELRPVGHKLFREAAGGLGDIGLASELPDFDTGKGFCRDKATLLQRRGLTDRLEFSARTTGQDRKSV